MRRSTYISERYEHGTAQGNKKIAIITGGSRGIGRDTGLELAKSGVVSFFTFNSHQEEAASVVAKANSLGGAAIAMPLDVNRIDSFPDFISRVEKELNGLGTRQFDYLVNSTGIGLSPIRPRGAYA